MSYSYSYSYSSSYSCSLSAHIRSRSRMFEIQGNAPLIRGMQLREAAMSSACGGGKPQVSMIGCMKSLGSFVSNLAPSQVDSLPHIREKFVGVGENPALAVHEVRSKRHSQLALRRSACECTCIPHCHAEMRRHLSPRTCWSGRGVFVSSNAFEAS